MTSPDGINWAAQPAIASQAFTSVVWAAGLGLFVAMNGNAGTYYYATSPNGTTWTPGTGISITNWTCVTWAQELGALVALTSNGRIGVSRDAVTWSFYSVTNVLWSSVCWAPELRTLCAVALNGNNSQQLMTTTVESTVADGITYDGEWLQIRLPKAAAPTSYTLAVQSGARMPTSWTVLGSTSPGIWKLLDRQTNVPSFTNQTQRTFTIQKPQKVETIRVVITKVQGGYAYTDVPDLRYVAFFDQDTPLNITSHGLRIPGNLNVHTRQGWDGDWSTLGGHIQPMLQKARDSCSIMPGLDTMRAGPAGSNGLGGVLMADGRVYIVPRHGTTARIFDPQSNTMSTPGGTFAPAYKFYGGTLLNDGRVFCVPSEATYAIIYDPATDTISTPTAVFPGGSLPFTLGVTMLDGRVFCVPYNATSAIIYDPVTDTTTTANTFGGGYFGGVLLQNGSVFCVPNNATRAAIYDPVTGTSSSTAASSFPGSSGHAGGVLLADGRVYCVPNSATTARMYHPATGTVTIPSGTFPGSSAYGCGSLLPDGRVFLTPDTQTTARTYDPVSDTLTTPSGTFSGFTRGAVLLPDGRVFAVPTGAITSRLVHTGGWGTYKLPTNVLTSPYLNTT
jgi:hypothetical protein